MPRIKDKNLLGCILVFACGVLWSTIGPFIRELSALGSSAYLTSFLRMAFATAVLALLTAWRYGPRSLLVDKRTLLFCIPLGVIGMGVNCIFYCWAVETAGVSISAVLLNVAPVAVAVMSRIFFSECITGRKCTALLINIAGCALTATGGSLDLASFSVFGALCAMGSGLCYAMCIIIGRFSGSTTNSFVLCTWSDLFSAIFLAFFLGASDISAMGNAPLMTVGLLYALIPTVIAYLLFYEGIDRMTDTTFVPILASMETVFAVLLGIAFYGDTLGAAHMIGIALVLLSIVLMNKHH